MLRTGVEVNSVWNPVSRPISKDVDRIEGMDKVQKQHDVLASVFGGPKQMTTALFWPGYKKADMQTIKRKPFVAFFNVIDDRSVVHRYGLSSFLSW